MLLKSQTQKNHSECLMTSDDGEWEAPTPLIDGESTIFGGWLEDGLKLLVGKKTFVGQRDGGGF